MNARAYLRASTSNKTPAVRGSPTFAPPPKAVRIRSRWSWIRGKADFLTDKAGDDDLEAARRAGRAVFRHLESFCEQLVDNFCRAARHGLTLTRGIAALTLPPLRAFWRPAIPDCVICASIVALLIHVASDSSPFQS